MRNPQLAEANLKIRPELELVLRAARPASPANLERIQQLLGNELDWSEFMACAIEHRLAARLDQVVRAIPTGVVSDDKRAALSELARNSAKLSLVFLAELLRLHAAFTASGIPAIPFKGPTLAQLAYPNFSQRNCVDLDFVLPQLRIPEAASFLESEGYVPHFNSEEIDAGLRGAAPGQYGFTSKSRNIHVELHSEKTLRYFARPLDLEAMSARLIEVKIGSYTVRTFSVEDLLVMLCVHGAKHFWERLAWIVDIAQIVTVCEVNWERLFQIAENMESVRVLLLGLFLAHELMQAPLPPAVFERARKDARVRWLANKVVEQLARKSHSSAGVLRRAAFRLRSSDGYLPGARHLIRLSTSPTESDRANVALPAFLSPVYALVRPLRLFREYGFGFKGRVKPDLAIYEPSPPEIVDRMLHFAGVGPGDVLYDLGCGDGRIVVAAAKKYGIKAVGVDINPKRIAEARANARRNGVEKQAQFILGDAKKLDVNEASVVILFLGADSNLRLVDRLRVELREGARIISRNFHIYGWEPDQAEDLRTPNGTPTTLYLWRIPKAKPEAAEDSCVPPGAAAAG